MDNKGKLFMYKIAFLYPHKKIMKIGEKDEEK